MPRQCAPLCRQGGCPAFKPVLRFGGAAGVSSRSPVETKLSDRVHELIEIDGLADVAVGPEIVALDPIPVLVRGGEDDHGDPLGARVGANPLQDLQTVDLGQLEIQQDDGRQIRRVAICVAPGAEEVVDAPRLRRGQPRYPLVMLLFRNARRVRASSSGLSSTRSILLPIVVPLKSTAVSTARQLVTCPNGAAFYSGFRWREFKRR